MTLKERVLSVVGSGVDVYVNGNDVTVEDLDGHSFDIVALCALIAPTSMTFHGGGGGCGGCDTCGYGGESSVEFHGCRL